MNNYKLLFLILVLLVLLISILLNYKEKFTNLNGINSFDKYFYINLENRPDRKEQITNELKKMNIPEGKIMRIDAVYNKYNGHIGCCKSHIKTIEMAKKLGLNNAVVFEDDFYFTIPKKEIDTKINTFLKKYPNFDLVQLTAGYKTLEDINDLNVKKVKRATTSSAYIINKKFYDKLLTDLNNSKNKMENEMIEFNKKNNNILKKKKETRYALDQHWSSLQKKSQWYIFDPYLGKQGGKAGRSSIMSNLETFTGVGIKFFKLFL